jgi:hypothetical protein
LLNESRAFQPEPGPVRDRSSWMMVPDDLDAAGRFSLAVAMMKMKPFGFPGIEQLNLAAQLPVVISHDQDRFAQILDPFQ